MKRSNNGYHGETNCIATKGIRLAVIFWQQRKDNKLAYRLLQSSYQKNEIWVVKIKCCVLHFVANIQVASILLFHIQKVVSVFFDRLAFSKSGVWIVTVITKWDVWITTFRSFCDCLFSRYVICTGLRTNGKEIHDYLYYINETILSLSNEMDILKVKPCLVMDMWLNTT